jgi:CRISPR-associated protein Csm5
VLGFIGEENLGQWVASIEKGEDLLERLPQLKGKTSRDLAARTIPCARETKKPIREQIRTGSDKALLPGSSLKGALRTTVWGETLLDNSKLAKDRNNLGIRDYRGGFRWSDAPLQKMFFGSDPNHDIFRLLQVGDAHFDRTEIFHTQIVNRKGQTWKIDRGEGKGISPEAWVEALPVGATATCEIRFNDMLQKEAAKQKTFNHNAPKLQLPALFALVNSFTKRLVGDEIDYWEKEDLPDGFDDFLDEMKSVLDAVEACGEGECVLRLGWGSGFRSMTGDWQGAMNDDDYDDLVNSLRSRKYEGLMFPKTLRFAERGIPMGFLKLTIINPYN